MRQYTDAIRQALAQQNWLAALAIALSLPDICGGLETPAPSDGKGGYRGNSEKRAVRWFDENMRHHYTRSMPVKTKSRPVRPALKAGSDEEAIEAYRSAIMQYRKERGVQALITTEPKVFLGGADCFALRCALLHEGSDQIDRQRAKRALEAFQFVVHKGNIRLRSNSKGSCLQLDLEIFCNQIADAVDAWSIKVANDPAVQGEMARLLKITYL